MKRFLLYLLAPLLFIYVVFISQGINLLFTDSIKTKENIMEELPGKKFFIKGSILTGGELYTIKESDINDIKILEDENRNNMRVYKINLSLSYDTVNKENGEIIKTKLKVPLTLNYKRKGIGNLLLSSVENTENQDITTLSEKTGRFSKLPIFNIEKETIIKNLYGISVYFTGEGKKGPRKLSSSNLKDINVKNIIYNDEKRIATLKSTLIVDEGGTSEDTFNITYIYNDNSDLWTFTSISR